LIFSITPSQIDVALKGAPNERPRFFIGKDETPKLRILASSSTLLILPVRTNSDLAKLIFKLDIASRHKNLEY